MLAVIPLQTRNVRDAAMASPPAALTATEMRDTGSSPAIHTSAAPFDERDFTARHRAFLAAATSNNTRHAYRSAIKHYLDWGGMLPTDEPAVIRYLVRYADTLNPRTLALRLTALSQWHVHQGFADPTASPTVRKTLAGIARSNGRPKKKARALPIEDLELIVAALASQGTLKAARDNALLQIGFFGGYRRSELAGIAVEHLTWDPQGITIMLPRSKTDQAGEGVVKAIPYSEGPCCPATVLRTWLDAAGITSGPVFRSITKWCVLGGDGLNPASVNAILADAAQLAQLGYVPELSSHSLRRGMATSAYRAGAEFRDIKKQGGWRHDGTVQGYIEEASLFEENAAGNLLRARARLA
jgi:integrase